MVVKFGLFVRVADGDVGFGKELFESFGCTERGTLEHLRELLIIGFVLRACCRLHAIDSVNMTMAKWLA